MSESLHQRSLIVWWDIACKQYNLPKYALYSNPNGGTRNPIEAVNLKRQGTRRGVPDLTLCVPSKGFHGLYIELKFGKNKISAEQGDFLEFLQAQNYQTAVCYDWLEAKLEIENYLK